MFVCGGKGGYFKVIESVVKLITSIKPWMSGEDAL